MLSHMQRQIIPNSILITPDISTPALRLTNRTGQLLFLTTLKSAMPLDFKEILLCRFLSLKPFKIQHALL